MRVDDQFQVGERVLDFLPFVEADAADDLVRDRLPHQRIFDRPRLRVGPIEDGRQRVDIFSPAAALIERVMKSASSSSSLPRK